MEGQRVGVKRRLERVIYFSFVFVFHCCRVGFLFLFLGRLGNFGFIKRLKIKVL